MMYDGLPSGNESRALVPTDNKGYGVVATDGEYHKWRNTHPWRREKTLPLVAAREGRADILRHIVLCRKNEANEYNCHKALITLVCEDDIKSLQTLYDAGVDLSNKNHKHKAVAIAAEYCNHDALQFLLEHGADPDQRSRNDYTALMWGAFHNDVETIRLLMKADANPLLRENPRKNGQTAYEIAYQERANEATTWLINYTARWEAKRRAAQKMLEPPAEKPLVLPAPACPQGWSVVNAGGAEMAIQTITDETSKTEIRNVFDFKGKRLLTEFRCAGGTPSLSDKKFDEIETALVTQAREIFDASVKKAEPPATPGLI